MSKKYYGKRCIIPLPKKDIFKAKEKMRKFQPIPLDNPIICWLFKIRKEKSRDWVGMWGNGIRSKFGSRIPRCL
jgi:hypothetical protein